MDDKDIEGESVIDDIEGIKKEVDEVFEETIGRERCHNLSRIYIFQLKLNK